MGRKARHSDSEFENDGDFDSDELNMEQEEDDFDDEQHGEEEEEESENEEEDGQVDGEEENGDGKNDNKDAEMEELEKEYMNLRHQEQDILKNLKRHKDEDLLKGQAVKNQKALWDKALEFRFLLLKAFSNSNRLPQEPVRSLFCDSHQGVSTAYSDLVDSSKRTLDSLVELQEVNLDNLRSQSHLRRLTVMVMRIGHRFLSCCRE